MKYFTLRALLLMVACSFSCSLSAQNLVPNSSFETVLSNPTSQDQLQSLAVPWLKLNATPDLYYAGQTSLPITACDQVDVPNNAGGHAPERTGLKGYAGLQFDLNNNYREYISTPLAIPLLKDTLYRVWFYVLRADSSRYACNKIGALFTNNFPIQTGTSPIAFPSIIESNTIITDTVNWTIITGIYKATGGENYITIGLFYTDANPALQKTDFGPHATGCASFDNSAYYYVDDVVVKPVSESVKIKADTVICPNESVTLNATSNVPFYWSEASTPTDTLSLAASVTVSPTVPTTYYLNGLFVKDSVTITIVNPPIVNLGPDSLLCEGDTVLLDATITDGINYQWSTGDTTSSIKITTLGDYSVIVNNIGCARTDTISFTDYLPNPPINLGEDSLYCFFSGDTLHLDAGIGYSYLWFPTGETKQKITVLSEANYSVKVIHNNGCPRTASLEVLEVCVPTLFIPSAFTPDGDGLNDVFQPIINNVSKYSFRVLNKFGQTVFYTDNPGLPWDGKYNGKDALDGVYVYRINFEGLDSEGDKLKGKKLGTITLLR